jgi:hypothetical protein
VRLELVKKQNREVVWISFFDIDYDTEEEKCLFLGFI